MVEASSARFTSLMAAFNEARVASLYFGRWDLGSMVEVAAARRQCGAQPVHFEILRGD